MLLAHIRNSDFAEQSVQSHLENVSLIARQYGNAAGLGAHAELAGLLHDMGKFTQSFTNYLKDAVIEQNTAHEKIDHSTAGAKYLYDYFYNQTALQNYVVETIGMAILSHHSGLQNFIQPDLKPSDFIRRVTNKTLPYYEEVVYNFESIEGNSSSVQRLIQEATEEFEHFMERIRAFKKPLVYLNLMQKFVFSCLIDADRTDTRRFEENEKNSISTNHNSIFQNGYQSLMTQVDAWENQETTPINQLRNQLSENCDRFADKASGIYRLTIPTGGGKTAASLRYALKHAQKYHKERIIYVVPYTTILEQNAAAVRDMINQPEAVLEHHANVIDDAHLDNDMDYYQIQRQKQLQLGRDNWDYPIIFTTTVQYLDAFFQKGTRKGRRLHNLTNSVIVFDEVQAVPYQHIELFNTTVNFLHSAGNSSILLCTATQPALDKLGFPVENSVEMVPDLEKTVQAFKRVTFHNLVDAEGWDADQIGCFAEQIIERLDSVLIILNTKTAVKRLYESLADQSAAYVVHLSTSMCPAHRKEKLADIKRRLGHEKVICISTQLIEAGVDISFASVIRSLAGLDSIGQAAGRCNRNQEAESGEVYIIRAKDERLSRLPEIRIGGEITENYILSNPKYADNLLSPESIRTYFTHFQAQADRDGDVQKTPRGLDYPLINMLDGSFAAKKQPQTRSSGMFKTLEHYFEAIASPTTGVLVPFKEGADIIARLNEAIDDISRFNQLMKQAQQYSVNLFDHELQKLSSENLIMPLFNNTIYCLNDKAYDEAFGVTLEGQAELEDYNF